MLTLELFPKISEIGQTVWFEGVWSINALRSHIFLIHLGVTDRQSFTIIPRLKWYEPVILGWYLYSHGKVRSYLSSWLACAVTWQGGIVLRQYTQVSKL
jgi:hypothetical protein